MHVLMPENYEVCKRFEVDQVIFNRAELTFFFFFLIIFCAFVG